MEKGYILIVFGLIIEIWGLSQIFSNDPSPIIFLIPAGIIFAVIGVFYLKNYRNKTYYLICFSLTVLFGLYSIISYGYDSYPNLLVSLLMLVTFSRSYYYRERNLTIDWKNEW